TSFSRDWSSDVCSSDLILGITLFNSLLNVFWIKQTDPWGIVETSWGIIGIFSLFSLIYHFRYKTSEANIPLTEIRYLKETNIIRSEERRVGKECRSRRS